MKNTIPDENACAWIVRTKKNSQKLFRKYNVYFCSRNEDFIELYSEYAENKKICYIVTGVEEDNNPIIHNINLIGKIKYYGLIQDILDNNLDGIENDSDVADEIREAHKEYLENRIDVEDSEEKAKRKQETRKATKCYFYMEEVRNIFDYEYNALVCDHDEFKTLPVYTILNKNHGDTVIFDTNKSELYYQDKICRIKKDSKQWALCDRIYIYEQFEVGESFILDDIVPALGGADIEEIREKKAIMRKSALDVIRRINKKAEKDFGFPIFKYENLAVERLR